MRVDGLALRRSRSSGCRPARWSSAAPAPAGRAGASTGPAAGRLGQARGDHLVDGLAGRLLVLAAAGAAQAVVDAAVASRGRRRRPGCSCPGRRSCRPCAARTAPSTSAAVRLISEPAFGLPVGLRRPSDICRMTRRRGPAAAWATTWSACSSGRQAAPTPRPALRAGQLHDARLPVRCRFVRPCVHRVTSPADRARWVKARVLVRATSSSRRS